MFNLSNVRNKLQNAKKVFDLFISSGTPAGYNVILLNDLSDIDKKKVKRIKPIKDWGIDDDVKIYGYDVKMSNGIGVAVSYHEADNFDYQGLRFCPIEHTELGSIWNIVGQHIESKYKTRINWVGFYEEGIADKGMIFGLIPKTNIVVLINHD